MNPAASGPVKAVGLGLSSARLVPRTTCLGRSLLASAGPTVGLGARSALRGHGSQNAVRLFSTTSPKRIEEYFPPPKSTKRIIETESRFEHPVFTAQQMKDIRIAHRESKDWADWIALGTVRLLRWGTDLATGYKHPAAGKEPTEKSKQFHMNERKWLIRFIFLESVAGVPGMVGGMLRHLRSLRRMKRDLGWIETLLEEAYNERMHLLTFLKLARPGWFMRLMVLGAQGVFFNGFFLSYLVSPKICHRFVGYLEEEAVMTYTHAINDLESGKLPKWTDLSAPDIAVNYWNMPEDHRKMVDLLYYVRADEAKHREVNHTLANLNPKIDPNPYGAKYSNGKAHPTKTAEIVKPTGWERQDVL